MIKSALRHLLLQNTFIQEKLKGGVHPWKLPSKYVLPAIVTHRIAGPYPETLSHGGARDRYYITQEQVNVIGRTEREISELADAIENALCVSSEAREVTVSQGLTIEVLNIYLLDRQDSTEGQFLKEDEQRLIMEFECEWRKRYDEV